MYSESSSPPSPPSACIDTSPASSPAPDIYDDNDPPVSLDAPQDPFSAAQHRWKPPDYEKKRPSSPNTPPSTVKKRRPNRPFEPTIWTQASPTNTAFRVPVTPPSPTPEEEESQVWEGASARIVDEGNGNVDLQNMGLKHIPESFIEVLSSFFTPNERSELDYVPPLLLAQTAPPVTRPLGRALTEPSSAETWGRPMMRTQSVAAGALGFRKNEIHLFLQGNQISVIPLSLLRSGELGNLTVLSLRNNNLTRIPPEIANLKGLKELSIGQNRIQYLPAEILQLTLNSLTVFPNPFHEPPPSSDPKYLGSSTISRRNLFSTIQDRRQVSKTDQKTGKVPALMELLARILLSPAEGSDTVLEKFYELPLPEGEPQEHSSSNKIYFPDPLPPHFRKILDACLPGSVYLEEDPDSPTAETRYTAESTGIGSCPSPLHQRFGTPRLFIQHAEERFTWEKTIAGVEVGGCVPVRWRGCQYGCLDFLDPPGETPEARPTLDDEGLHLDDGDYEIMMDGVVQLVHLGAIAPVGLEDFDDE
ncbi:hypothetical protein H0H92_005826 [Tricholoma furcatifolium]|nr:hypothetical protein H0H92_005826 [Tricholoma furcatifolium]